MWPNDRQLGNLSDQNQQSGCFESGSRVPPMNPYFCLATASKPDFLVPARFRSTRIAFVRPCRTRSRCGRVRHPRRYLQNLPADRRLYSPASPGNPPSPGAAERLTSPGSGRSLSFAAPPARPRSRHRSVACNDAYMYSPLQAGRNPSPQHRPALDLPSGNSDSRGPVFGGRQCLYCRLEPAAAPGCFLECDVGLTRESREH